MAIKRTLGYRKSSVGSREFVLKKTRPIAEDLGNERLVEKIDLGLDKYRTAATLRLKYLMQRDTNRSARNEAVKLDVDVDNTVSDLFGLIELHANRRRESDKKKAAQRIMKRVFPSGGVFPITSSQYDEEHALINTLVDELEQNFADEIDLLDARDLLEDLETVNAEFGKALDIIDRDVVTYAELQAQIEDAEDAFNKVMLIIHADYCDDDATRQKLLEAAEAQDARTAAYYRRRGVPPEVDPDTGEPIEDVDTDPVVDEDVDVDEPVTN
ncbi:hypothetical protein FIV42_08160 [Persicimonas caeni]|jgi:hypothetical protein|uniref:Uncharacterized protein n=1 Tax=Persicimonas caeni TaxID=2292766 RepID=A0A4Y6PQU8_PERCE|nr:DUF6261 family protein [Persicimonas caeni]QDG50702.1 hypothetical protein FIV42_08160 [Persicimonas caeni]QED31923.1 hypothetical protein FRD00_08155 [Persicimonas caeni]